MSETAAAVIAIVAVVAVTTLGRRQVGDEVNVETDVLAKYVAKLMGPRHE